MHVAQLAPLRIKKIIIIKNKKNKKIKIKIKKER